MSAHATAEHAVANGEMPEKQTAEHSQLAQAQHPQPPSASDALQVKSGPLLNYKYSTDTASTRPIWHGSVLLVTAPGQAHPRLELSCLGHVQNSASMANGATTNGSSSAMPPRSFPGEKLFEDRLKAFWRFSIDLPLQSFEASWQYVIPNCHYLSDAAGTKASAQTFHVPAAEQSMRIMFHSCNGFSVGTDEEAYSGPALWNDVLRMHAQKPFHVMIGGGDQIYNDSIRVSGPLAEWTSIANPIKRHDFPFTTDFRDRCDEWYFNNYVTWYGTGAFAVANGQIPQINEWDDHDIIDGFGSYADHSMKAPVFLGIGDIAYRYFCLFQHHVPPPRHATFTTDKPSGSHGESSALPQNNHVLAETRPEPCFILGNQPGPYIKEPSRSIYCQLGARIAFAAFDCRTERTRHLINNPETYEKVFSRVNSEIAKSNGKIKHLILLLGVPIAYPRLQWLEAILGSPLIRPIRFMNKRFGVADGLFNKFDGGVDLLDDLDDHYTAHQHKKERKELVEHLQKLSKALSIRVTILGGDVHLAALGRFYSNPNLGIAPENDWRYMANIVSSAITNKPPPAAVANLLARRNKIHHLDHETDETLLNLFDRDPGPKNSKTASSNHCTMPSRNYAIISESAGAAAAAAAAHARTPVAHHNRDHKGANPRDAMHAGEAGCGTGHPAAGGLVPTGLAGPDGLDVTVRVEVDQHNREGETLGYGMSIPGLVLADGAT